MATRLGYSEARHLNRWQFEEVKRRERQLGAYIAVLIEAYINENSLRPVNAQLLAYQCLIVIRDELHECIANARRHQLTTFIEA